MKHTTPSQTDQNSISQNFSFGDTSIYIGVKNVSKGLPFFSIFFVTVASRFSRTLKPWKLSESDENAGERVFDLFQSVSSVPDQLQRHVRGMKRHDRTKKQKEHATRHLI